jgi:uncharacterized protein involved in outer membrane biogenesis
VRKAIIGLGILFFTLLVGLIAAPRFVDFERLKVPLARELEARIGRSVRLAGPLGFSLLPVPSLTARDVRVANPAGAAVSDMVKLRALEVKLAFWPLLAGRFEVRGGRLVEPEIDIERQADGSINWPTSPGREGPGTRAMSAGLGDADFALSLDRLSIQDAAVTYRSGARVERLEHITGEAAIDAATGSLRATGKLVAHGATLTLVLRCGRLDAAEIPIQLTLATSPATELHVDALIAGKPGERRIDGKIKLTTADAQALLGRAARFVLPTALAQPTSLAGQLSGTLQTLVLDPLTIDVGPAHAEGRLRWRLEGTPDMALALTVARLDLDHWPSSRQSASPSSWSPLARAYGTETSAAAMGADWPTAINGSVEIGVDALIWRGRLVQDARLRATLGQGRLRLERLGASLPGGSEVALSGSALLGAEGVRSEGVVEISSDDLRQLGAWLGIRLDAVPADRLRKASLSSRFASADDRLDLEALDATLDATRFTGAATVLLRAHPGIGLRLEADRLNLDAYWPQTPSAGETAALDIGDLSAVDLNLDARIEALTWHGQPMSDVHLAGLLRDGEITVRELAVGDIAGARGKLTGVVAGLSAGMPRGQLAFDMHGVELGRLLRLVVPDVAGGRTYGAFSFGGGLQSDGTSVTLDTDLEALNARAHAGGELVLPAGAMDLRIDLEHPDIASLAHGLAPNYQMAGNPGALKIAGHVHGDRRKIALDDLTIVVGEARLAGRVALDRTGSRPRVEAELEAGDWRIDPFLPARQTAAGEGSFRQLTRPPAGLHLAAAADSGAPPRSILGFADFALRLEGQSMALSGWRIDQPVLSLSLDEGVLSLKQLGGRFLGGLIAASGRFAAASRLDAQLSLRNADLKEGLQKLVSVGAIEGRMDVDATLACAEECVASPTSRLVGDVTLHGHDGSLSGIDLKAMSDRLESAADLVALLRSGAGGRTPFTSLDGRFRLADGIAASEDLRVRMEGAEALAMLRLDWPRQLLTSRIEFHFTGMPAAPPLVIRLDGATAAPRVVVEANAFEQYLTQHPAASPATSAHQP